MSNDMNDVKFLNLAIDGRFTWCIFVVLDSHWSQYAFTVCKGAAWTFCKIS